MTISRQTDEESVIYPESDGKPMADNTRQFRYISMLKNGFDALFLDQDDVFVAGDLLWYPIEGDNKTRYAPDVMIAFGRPKGDRGSYLQWQENNQPPQVTFEVLSPGNTRKEMGRKLAAYDDLGVEEYYEYDPDRGQLRGWLRDPTTTKLKAIPNLLGWQSPRTGVTLQLNGKDLEVTRPDGERFLDSEDNERDRIRLKERVEQESKRAEQESKRAEQESKRAEQESKRAKQESKRAEQESKRAEQEKAEKEKLAAKLRELGVDPDSV